MMRWIYAAAAALMIGGLLVTLVLQSRPALPGTEPQVDGTITKIDGFRILVEADPAAEHGPKCWFSLTPETRILRQSPVRMLPASPADLAAGMKVKAWASGPVRESYPCQGEAAVILIQND